MSYIIFVIDELIQVVSDKESRERLHTFMSKCASYGIYFILASQDCTKEVIGRCKMNCSQIIGFHTFDSTDSDTLIGKNNNLQDITVKGRCKIKNSEGISEVQIFYLEEDEFIMVHSGVSFDANRCVKALNETPKEELVYKRTFKAPDLLIDVGKCVFFGHTPTSYVCGEPKILIYKKDKTNGESLKDYYKIHLDTGNYLSGVLGGFCIDTLKVDYVCQ